MTRCVRLAVLSLVLALLGTAHAAALEIHGELDQFSSHGIAMVWAILKAAAEEESRVVVRLVPLETRFVSVSIDGVDPFTQRRQELLPRAPLGLRLDTATPRAGFADLPRREFHFYVADQADPAVTVYFLGLPDTTPEFLAESQLSTYLDATIAKLRRAER